jgi:signal transduction histidine kinase
LRLEALVRSLLAFVKSGQSQRADTALLPILRAAIGSTALEQGTVLLDESGVPERWQIDPAQIERVLHNLVDNALQAAPPNTPVLVGARVQADRLWFSVHDSGPGIDPAIADRLFEPFVTTRLHGTGLGLAIAREMVRAHGGELDMIAPAEGGTTFRFWIPRGRG